MFENFIEQFNAQKDELVRDDTKGEEREGFESGIWCVLNSIERSGSLGSSWEEVLSELEDIWRRCFKNFETVPFRDFAWNMNCGEILVCQFFLFNCDTRENKFDIDVFRESLRTL